MKIALTTDSFVEGHGGVSTAVNTLAQNLRQRGHQVMIYTAADPSHKNIDLDVVGLRALRYERFPGGRIPMAPISLVQELIDFKPDIIHNHSMSAMGIQALSASRLLGLPIIGTCHVFLAGFLQYAPISLEGVPLTKDIAWRYTTVFFNRFSQVTTPSEVMRSELLKHGLRVPIAAISNGVDTNLFCPSSQEQENTQRPLRLLHMGRLGYEKGVDQVLRAFALLVGDFPQARLQIVGTGPDEEMLKSLSRDLNIDDCVTFTGFVAHQDLPALCQKADLFVTASTIETQGLVVLEAMSAGLPIVGVDALALPNLIHNEVNGFLVPPGDEFALSQAVARLLSSPDLRQEMGAASRRLALEHSPSLITQAYENLYQQAIAQAPRPLLTRIPEKLDPAVAWSSFRAEGQALKEAGYDRVWEISRSLRHWTEKTYGQIVEQVRSGLPRRRGKASSGKKTPTSQTKNLR